MTTTVLDLTDQIKKYNIAVFDVSLYDYIVIQRIGGAGEMYLTSTNDSGAIEGVSNGGVSRPVKCETEAGATSVYTLDTLPSKIGVTVGTAVYGPGIAEQSQVDILVNETIFLNNNALSSSTDAQLTFVFAKNFLGLQAENLANGSFNDAINPNTINRVNSPFGKWVKLLGDLGSTTDKLLVFCSKIY